MGIASAAIIIMLGNALSRVLGMVREMVIAGLFGSTAATDAFTAASRVPVTLYDLLIGGMIAAALVPVFSDYFSEEAREDLGKIISALLVIMASVMIVVMLAIFLLAPWIIGIVGQGYPPEVQALATDLLRVMLPSLLFLSLSAIFTSVLYAGRRFTFPAFCAAAYNLGMIGAALVFYEALGVTSLVAGMLLGSLLQVIIQVPAMRGLSLRLVLDLRHPALIRIGKLYAPVAAGLLISMVGIAIDTNLASTTGEGGLAAMRFATTLVQLPLGLVAAALAAAILPTLSRYGPSIVSRTSPEDVSEYRRYLALGIKMVLLAIIPAAVGLVLLREPVVHIVFQRGNFDVEATQRTALAFLGYAPSLPAAAIDQMLIFAFYALKNTIVPVLVGILGVGVYLAVALTLITPLGFFGLTLANSAQIVSHTLVLLFLLSWTLKGLSGLGLRATLLKVVAASLVMAGVITASGQVALGWLDLSTTAGALAYVLAAGGAGALAYIGAVLLLDMEEARLVWTVARQRLGRPDSD